jgi:Uncharacterized protein involved in copper resistance
MLYGIKIEICAGSLTDIALADQYSEVDRIECNSHLEEDGLSMDHTDFQKARVSTAKQLFCMVRQRPGDFIYSLSEQEQMLLEAKEFLEAGADGIVFGCLTRDGTIETSFTKKMITLIHSYQKEAVFHKAFDVSNDLFVSAKILADQNCDRILTSGGAPDCIQGMPALRQLQDLVGDRIQILPGGGIKAENVCGLLKDTRITRFHMSLRSDHPEQKLVAVLEAIREQHVSTKQHVLTSEDEAMFEADPYEANMDVQDDTYTHE